MPSPIAKPRSIRSLLVVIVLWCQSTAAFEASLPAFEIEHDGVSVGYLVGTMHTEDPRVMAQVEGLVPLVREVDTLAVEVVPDGLTMMAVGVATLLPADQQLSHLIGEERFAALGRAADARSLPVAVLERLKPWAAAVTIGLPMIETGEVMDTALYLAALGEDRRIVGLETAAEQIAVFDGMPLDLQLTLLDAMLKNVEQLPIQLEALTEAFLSGDLARLEQAARGQYGDVPAAVRHWFERELLEARNARMLLRILPELEEGRVLIAVGALHLPGPTGLLNGLRERGFDVRPLTGLP